MGRKITTPCSLWFNFRNLIFELPRSSFSNLPKGLMNKNLFPYFPLLTDYIAMFCPFKFHKNCNSLYKCNQVPKFGIWALLVTIYLHIRGLEKQNFPPPFFPLGRDLSVTRALEFCLPKTWIKCLFWLGVMIVGGGCVGIRFCEVSLSRELTAKARRKSL